MHNDKEGNAQGWCHRNTKQPNDADKAFWDQLAESEVQICKPWRFSICIFIKNIYRTDFPENS